MCAPKLIPGDFVTIIGGKCKGHHAFVVEMKPKMVEIKLLPSLTQVQVMVHNVSYPTTQDKNIAVKFP
jgi:ribosomal protein L24